ncbi:hypothetical protein [Roseateles cavernae]|uniref:hypothetical protein n=1 Tax=Roseateles cavernae TaxID=3153578 RepID=UPI0032E40FA4
MSPTAWPYKPPCRNPGLSQGFVRFGTLAHRLLLALHTLGDLRSCDLVDELDADLRCVATNLIRLRDAKFIYARGKVCGVPNNERTQMRWTLKPTETTRYRRLSANQRRQRYQARLKLRAPSVFAFRGRIEIGATA